MSRYFESYSGQVTAEPHTALPYCDLAYIV